MKHLKIVVYRFNPFGAINNKKRDTVTIKPINTRQWVN